MDAHALLTSQGWRGTGNSLHPTNNSIGLSKPLLISQKQNNLGIGKKQHKTSDMWWMNAFDSTLKGLDTSKEGQVVQTLTSGGLDMVAKGGSKWVGSAGGLYSSFVRGECLSGTITPEESEEPAKKKRKREENGKESKEERHARKAAKQASKDSQAVILKAPIISVEKTKEERRAKKAAKRSKNVLSVDDLSVKPPHEEEFDAQSDEDESKERRKARKAAKKALKEKKFRTLDNTPVETEEEDTTKKPESKEERKERKWLKKLQKEADSSSSDVSSEKISKKKKRKD